MKHILNTSRDPELGALVLGQNQGVRRDGVATECWHAWRMSCVIFFKTSVVQYRRVTEMKKEQSPTVSFPLPGGHFCPINYLVIRIT